jgi:hypothetical protein
MWIYRILMLMSPVADFPNPMLLSLRTRITARGWSKGGIKGGAQRGGTSRGDELYNMEAGCSNGYCKSVSMEIILNVLQPVGRFPSFASEIERIWDVPTAVT